MWGLFKISVSIANAVLIFVYTYVFLFGAVFEQVTKNSVRGLWARRSRINLVGAHIDVFTGEWTQKVTLLSQ